MANELIIGGTERISYLRADSLRVEQSGGAFAAVCSFTLDEIGAASLPIAERDTVLIKDSNGTLFAGEVQDIDWDTVAIRQSGRAMSVHCTDYNRLIEETIIAGGTEYVAYSDAQILDRLFSAYRSDIDATTHVNEIKLSMTVDFGNTTLLDAVQQIAKQAGATWYVDYAKRLHWFNGSEGNQAAWFLSDYPGGGTAFPYQSISRRSSGKNIVNQVLIVGRGNLTSYVEHAASIGSFGPRATVIQDTNITTVGSADSRGTAVLNKYAYPEVTYNVRTRKKGLRAGMDVPLKSQDWGIDEVLTVRRLTIQWSGESQIRSYDLELGDGVAKGVRSGGSYDTEAGQRAVEGSVQDLEDSVFDTDEPATPTFSSGNLSTGVREQNDGTQLVWVTITWGAVTDDDLAYYEVQLSTASDFSADVMTRRHPKDGDREETWEGVQGNTTYYFRVRAIDWAGNASAWSSTENTASSADSGSPAQVGSLTAAGARTIIGLSWAENTEADLARYEVQRSPNGSTSWATKAYIRTTHWIDEDFTEAQVLAQDTFYYRVRAIDTSGNEGTFSANASASLDPLGSDVLASDVIIARHVGTNKIITDTANIGTAVIESADINEIYAEKLAVTVGGYNLLANSGFNDDDDGDGVPDEWTHWTNGSNVTYELDTSTKVVGSSCFHYTQSTGDLDGEIARIEQDITLADVPLAVGDDFVLSGYIKADSISNLTVRIRVRWRDSGNNAIQSDYAGQVASDQDWTRHTVTNTVPATAVKAEVHCVIILTANDGTGEARFDAIKIERGDMATAWTTGLVGNVIIDSNRVQVEDSGAKVWMGKRGGSLGMWGEDASGNLQVGWYASGSNKGAIQAAGTALRLDADGLTMEAANAGWSTADERMMVEWTEGTASRAMVYGLHHGAGTDGGALILQAEGEAPLIHLSDQVIIGTPIDRFSAIDAQFESERNGNMGIGLTIHQGTHTDQFLAFKNLAINHGMTDITDSDTVFYSEMLHGTDGGIALVGLTDGTTQPTAFLVSGIAAAANTNKTTSADAVVQIEARLEDAPSIKNVTSNGNLMCVKNGSTTRFIVDAEGDIYRDATTNRYDAFDDGLVVQDLKSVLTRNWDRVIHYNAELLEEMGIIGPADQNGERMLSQRNLDSLFMGAIEQLYRKVEDLSNEKDSLFGNPSHRLGGAGSAHG
jgi:hypothetical protein